MNLISNKLDNIEKMCNNLKNATPKPQVNQHKLLNTSSFSYLKNRNKMVHRKFPSNFIVINKNSQLLYKECQV